MDNRLVLGKILIIEWLLPADPATGRAQDRRTGEEVYRELKLLIPDTGSRVELAFHSVATRAEFVDLLERIEQESRASGKVPLLQIETHGDEEGIGPSHADGLTWPELMTALTPLNLATGVRLIDGACAVFRSVGP
jgi:hypothetical protein